MMMVKMEWDRDDSAFMAVAPVVLGWGGGRSGMKHKMARRGSVLAWSASLRVKRSVSVNRESEREARTRKLARSVP